jgi:hypothetical protein
MPALDRNVRDLSTAGPTTIAPARWDPDVSQGDIARRRATHALARWLIDRTAAVNGPAFGW